MDPLSLVAEHCEDSGHTFAFQNIKILGRGNHRIAMETIEPWHTETISINRCVALQAAYQALRTQFDEGKSKREVRPDVDPNTEEPTTDLHVATPQIRPDEGTVTNTATSITTPADGEKRGQWNAIKTINPRRQIRSTRMRAMATNIQMSPPPQRGTGRLTTVTPFRSAPGTTETMPVRNFAIETVGDLFESQYDDETNKPKRGHLIQMLHFCLKTYFTFEGSVYEQIKGTPMGSPLSGFIAEAVLQKLETLVFATHRPIFWARYVDDTFVILKREMVSEFHTILNSVFPDIQFTREAEVNNQLAFLDVLVHRKTNGSLRTTVYRKATNTRQVLSYYSNHLLCHKRSCVRTLYKRAETHCIEATNKVAELHYLRQMFISNGYPRSFIERSRQTKKAIRSTREQPTVWWTLTYTENVSEAVARPLQPLGIGVAHRPEATIRRLVMRPKAPLSRGETANVVHRVQCSSSEANYVGETGKRLQTRMSEHARAVRRMDQLSLVAEHCATSGHTFVFQNAEILG
nr:unnamed protein product [Spirometra erinaceieuropaei]